MTFSDESPLPKHNPPFEDKSLNVGHFMQAYVNTLAKEKALYLERLPEVSLELDEWEKIGIIAEVPCRVNGTH